jgi:branched-chain amino acid transport system substrate-binding protein
MTQHVRNARGVRSILILSVLLVVVMVTGHTGSTLAQATPPIKVGVTLPLTGPLAALGILARTGMEFAFEEVGYQVAGRKIILVVEDSEAKPDVGLTKARKLVEHDKVDLVLGPISSAVALAMRDYMVGKGLPWVMTFATAPQLTRDLKAPNLFRSSWSAEQPQFPAGEYVRRKLGYQKITAVGLDYVAGRAEMSAFLDGFRAAGGRVVQEIFIPLGTPDPAPFITRIKPDEIDAVVGAAIWGSDAIRFVKALDEYGIKGRVPIVVTNAAVTGDSMLPSIGKAALGVKSYGAYPYGLDTVENKRFVEGFRKKVGKMTGNDSYAGYICARVAIEALKAVEGRVEDTPRYLAAMRAVEFTGPAGPFSFDRNQNAVTTLYLQEVREAGGELYNALVEVIARGVTQR